MTNVFESFADTHASRHDLTFSQDATRAIVGSHGEFVAKISSGPELYDDMARTGMAIMHAALIELRGEAAENPALIDELDRSIKSDGLSHREQSSNALKMSGGLLNAGWLINGSYEKPEGPTIGGFYVGMSILSVGRAAARFATHPLVTHKRSGGLSVSGGEHRHDQLTRLLSPGSERSKVESLGDILNTHPSRAVAIGTHSYEGNLDRSFRFTATTTFPGHSVATSIRHWPSRRYDGNLRITLATDSHHVESRGHSIEVDPRNSGSEIAVSEVYDSLQTVI